MKKPPNGHREGVAFLEGSAFARPISELVAEVDALLGGPSIESELAPKALDTDAIWKAHNSRSAPKGIRQ